MIGLPLGLLYANAVEWVVHKYVLHGMGKKKDSFFAFHWRNHHKNCRRYANYDPDYEKPWYDWRSRGKEAGGILALMAVHLPLAPVAPWFTAAVCYASFNYLYKHEKCHVDVEWGKKHMRSHYDHHMGKNQDMNWCVTQPWFDYIMGTREHFFDENGAARPIPSGVQGLTSQAPDPVVLRGDTLDQLALTTVAPANSTEAVPTVPPAA